jgi:hypothetical protein
MAMAGGALIPDPASKESSQIIQIHPIRRPLVISVKGLDQHFDNLDVDNSSCGGVKKVDALVTCCWWQKTISLGVRIMQKLKISCWWENRPPFMSTAQIN